MSQPVVGAFEGSRDVKSYSTTERDTTNHKPCKSSDRTLPSSKIFPKTVQHLRLDQHARTRSATVLSTTPSPLAHTHSGRNRASSSTSPLNAGSCRSRLYSFTSLGSGSVPKADAVKPVAVGADETIGSFTPTSCPRQHLHSLLGDASPKSRLRDATRRLNISTNALLPRRPSEFFAEDSARSLSPPDSPIPSICRTPSSCTDSEYFPTAPSSAGPLTPVHSTDSSPHARKHALQSSEVLEALEARSRFCLRTSCATCHRPGTNFPCCPRCGEMWCSRECRLQSGNGKRHICAGAR
ncbi:unnamed protein product [Somion occarium]|uniref:MYND-type domain-containing protein n=1 Tax=Somion occarium TaxID=3059160 RepID=A0ABP1DZ56_9APHY